MVERAGLEPERQSDKLTSNNLLISPHRGLLHHMAAFHKITPSEIP
jgi:hypothetical protein